MLHRLDSKPHHRGVAASAPFPEVRDTPQHPL